ncbi:MAG: ADP-ribosylglycohydrolase family protein [Zetaproteobacteria bacterium]|nr:MAG: ADP-ribosylglycohydrolase family protein [Zetaproteobacteria bacterium]
MLGAIAGDIIGSVYEFRPIKHKDFEPLFAAEAEFTDDTVLTVAVADCLMNDRDPAEALKNWGRRYPYCSWGRRFREWLFSDDMEPYGSFGNGAAMRVSPAGFLADSLEDAWAMSDRVTRVTHNHPEGLKGARATVTVIVLARQGADAQAIREEVAGRFGYDMVRSVDEVRPGYRFDETCQRTVPEALTCALEAEDFEDAVRNAVSLGGDADTLAAIAGAVAEARFGVPDAIAGEVFRRLPEDMRSIADQYRCASGGSR